MKKFLIKKLKPSIDSETKIAADRSVNKSMNGIAFILSSALCNELHKKALENYFSNFAGVQSGAISSSLAEKTLEK